MKKWSRKHNCCVECGTVNIRHASSGKCRRCYAREKERRLRPKYKQKRGLADQFLTKEKLTELYIRQELSLQEIAELARCTRTNVYYKIIKYGISSRSKSQAISLALEKGKVKHLKVDEYGKTREILRQKNHFNIRFFKEWSPEMAYVLGLLYTDGNIKLIVTEKGSKSGRLIFAQKDIELVEKVLKAMVCDAKILFKRKQGIQGELYYFGLSGMELYDDLVRLGLTDNKSLNMQFPHIPEKYIRHFIRGVFDGDGSVYLEYGKRLYIKFLSGSKEFVSQLMEILTNKEFPKKKIYGGTKSSPHAYFIRYEAKYARDFFEYFYSGVGEEIYWTKKHYILYEYLKNKGKQLKLKI